jgi:hypothetical protein
MLGKNATLEDLHVRGSPLYIASRGWLTPV